MHTVNVDEVTPTGAFLTAGRYPARLLSSEGNISKKGNPMVVASFVVTGGDKEGLESKAWYTLTVTTKNGKKLAGGVIDIKKAFASVGKPLPSGFAFPAIPANDPSIGEADKQRVAEAASKLFGQRLKGVDLEILVTNDGELTDDDGTVKKDQQGNTLYRTRTTIIGTQSKAKAATAASPDDFNFDDE